MSRGLGRGALLAVLVGLVWCSDLHAVNRFTAGSDTFVLGSTGNQVSILMDADEDVYGFSISLEFDRNKIRITDVALGADAAAINPEWSEGDVDNTAGRLVHGVVFDLSGPTITKHMNGPTTNREILVLTIDVVAASETTAALNLVNVAAQGTNPIRWNLMSDADGFRISPDPQLVDGTITCQDLSPVITSVLNGSGEPDDQFTLVGRNFDRPGLTVSVGGRTATGIMVIDDQTVQATAPGCDSVGGADIEVCTNFGCTTRSNGYNYTSCGPTPPLITSLLSNTGEEGQVFLIGGIGFDAPMLTVRVGTTVLPAGDVLLLPDGQTIQAIAPACPPSAPGFVVVEVCTEFGCDSEANGFNYTRCPGKGGLQRPADCDQNGRIELTDGVCVLGHLFRGEPRRLPCGNGSIQDPANRALLDMDRNNSIDLTDAVGIFRYLFASGSRPPLCLENSCSSCVEIPGCNDVGTGC